MSLKEALKKQRHDPRLHCGCGAWIAALPADEQAAAAEFLLSDRRTSEIHEAFVSEGFSLQYNTTARHRNGRCACGRIGGAS